MSSILDRCAELENEVRTSDASTNRWSIDIHKIEQSDAMLTKVLKHCWGAENRMSRKRLMACSDSILDIPEYYAFCLAPRSVAMQMETHKKKNRFYLWMGTARPDRADAIVGEYSREQLVPFAMVFTARAIKEISHLRMCSKAEKATRTFMALLQMKLSYVDKELAENMMPLCKYRGGICTELNSCKKTKVSLTN
jgi:hypothetical protein